MAPYAVHSIAILQLFFLQRLGNHRRQDPKKIINFFRSIPTSQTDRQGAVLSLTRRKAPCPSSSSMMILSNAHQVKQLLPAECRDLYSQEKFAEGVL
jgi:hypothetical protein